MRFLALVGMALFSGSVLASSNLFYVIDIEEASEKEFILDQLYFDESPAPVRGDTIFGSGASTANFFSGAIDFMTDKPPSLCEQRECDIPSISLLDDSFKLYLPWLLTEGDVYVDGKEIELTDNYPSILYTRNDYFVSGLLGPEAISIYRLSNFFGLATVADLAKRGTAPFRDCPDLLGTLYSCDNVTNGGFSTTGNVMLGYLESCISCSDSDDAILRMIVTHHFLRSKSPSDIEKGIAIFSQQEETFKDVGINYGSLKELYLKALAKK